MLSDYDVSLGYDSNGYVNKFTITDINKNGITVSTKDYDIILKNIKLEGKNRCDVKDFINGIKKENFIGGIFNE